MRWVSRSLIEETLHEAGMAYLRRRRKSIVPTTYIQSKLDYSEWILKRRKTTLESFAYSDGTVFFLNRDLPENEQTQRAALGSHVWKMADGSESLYMDCVGPSTYGKAQGLPVKVWGLLAHGALHINVLDAGQSMDQWTYSQLIEEKFETWLGGCQWMVQDFERCLRTEEALVAMTVVGVQLVGLLSGLQCH